MKFILAFLLLLSSVCVNAQDSLKVDSIKVHSPKKAAIYSAILPGLGQIYNKKYWYVKVPVIYGGFVALAYTINYNHTNYIKYRDEYRNRSNIADYEPTGNLAFLGDAAIKLRRDSYRRYRDMNVMMTVGWYGLNVLEASVSAHLLDFDVSDDLSLKIQPYHSFTMNNQIANGISLRLSL